VSIFATKDQIVDAVTRLAEWNHSCSLLARAVYDLEVDWWLRDTYIGLILANARVYRLVNYALSLGDLTIAALAARNALELKVWIMYTTSGESNARRLYNDQMVDARDMLARSERLLTLMPDQHRPAELVEDLAASRRIMVDREPDFEFSEDQSYLKTHVIATQVGCGDEFKNLFPILSKMIHPTALSMFLNHSGQTSEHQTLQISNVALQYFAANIDMINAYFKGRGFPHIHEDEQGLSIRNEAT
jgi:hypothetical protein